VREALQSIRHLGLTTAARPAAHEPRKPRTTPSTNLVGNPLSRSATDDAGKQYLSMLQDFAKRYTKFDASRADWMCAVSMFVKGYTFEQIAHALLQHSPGLAVRKGDIDDYLLRTVGKAEIWHELRRQGCKYDDVRDELLTLARCRAAQRLAAKAA
jgi:hypothetical protein